ncbi:Arv1-domain-containing protein [Lentinula raphanica]|nr:Arv1-domain-containing protein [Lentinula raphanica]
MPVCTTCTIWLPHLYTVYQSAYNLRLEQCPNCHSFADPYVEHDELTLLIDLLLLKRAVYRHLLYNRGSEPRREDGSTVKVGVGQPKDACGSSNQDKKDSSHWKLVVRLGLTLTFIDAFIRWSHLTVQPVSGDRVESPSISPRSMRAISGFSAIFSGCCIETIAFHTGVIIACYIVLRALDLSFWRAQSDIRRKFRFSLIPLALFYSSFTKLFFLFLLTIWRPSRTPQHLSPSHNDTTGFLPIQFGFDILKALEFITDDRLDREWVVRNVMGGLSAGFGLRVILDINPIFTTFIILSGWIVKTSVSVMISGWIGNDVATAEAWLASSIP